MKISKSRLQSISQGISNFMQECDTNIEWLTEYTIRSGMTEHLQNRIDDHKRFKRQLGVIQAAIAELTGEKIPELKKIPDEYGRIGFKYEVLDMNLPEGRNIVWKHISMQHMLFTLRLTPIYSGESMV